MRRALVGLFRVHECGPVVVPSLGLMLQSDNRFAALHHFHSRQAMSRLRRREGRRKDRLVGGA